MGTFPYRRAEWKTAAQSVIPAKAGIQVFLTLFLFSCSARQDAPAKPAADNSPGVPRMTGFHLKHYEGPNLRYSLWAQAADLLEEKNKADVTEPLLVIHAPASGKPAGAAKVEVLIGPVKIRATGRRGQVNLATKDLILKGDVVYQVMRTSQTLTTSKLYYWAGRHEAEVMEGTGYKLATPKGVIEGSGMISKEELE